jgi:hypothetical protein
VSASFAVSKHVDANHATVVAESVLSTVADGSEFRLHSIELRLGDKAWPWSHREGRWWGNHRLLHFRSACAPVFGGRRVLVAAGGYRSIIKGDTAPKLFPRHQRFPTIFLALCDFRGTGVPTRVVNIMTVAGPFNSLNALQVHVSADTVARPTFRVVGASVYVDATILLRVLNSSPVVGAERSETVPDLVVGRAGIILVVAPAARSQHAMVASIIGKR